MNKRKLDPDYEIYSQFSGKPHDYTEQFRSVNNPALNSYDAQSHKDVMESLKNNEYFDTETFERFLQRKQGKGIRTKFINRLT